MSEFIQIGSLLGGRYEIIEKIGAGGMAEVYKARCRLLNRYVAIKALKPEYAGDAEFLKRFEIEAQAAASLSHPNIVSVYDVGYDAGRHYIVMELVEGVTLKGYIAKKGALPWREAAGFAAQICSALECAHKKRIIHRDIKPHNIIITPEGVAKVTDFGIARAASSTTMVADGSVMGSAHYLSPEQARGGYTDEKSDIYSAGVTLYEMLTGRVPYEADSPVSVAMMHVSGDLVQPRIINPDIPEDMEKIVLKAMSKEQSLRYASAEDMLYDINAVLSNRAIAPAPEPTQVMEGRAREGARRRGAQAASDTAHQAKNKSKGKKDKQPLTKSEKRMVWLAVAAAVVLIGIVGVVCMSWFGVFGAWQWDETVVPEIEGKTLEEATKLLKDARLELDIDEEIASTQYEKDTIISQEPAAGRTVKKGVKVRVKVSTGIGDKISIPNVVNYEKENAKSTLEKSGFVVVFTEEESDTVPENTVIRQSPAAGTEAKSGDTVRLYVSGKAASEKVPVPNVIGKSLAQAKNDIEAAGLVVGNVAEQESEQAVGTVIRQSPSGGMADKKSAVALTVSKGQKATPTPTPNTPTPPPPSEEPQKVKTISLPVPQNKESTQIRVVANGTTIHDALHHKSEVSFDLRVTGRNTATLEIYHDGTLVGTQTVNF